MAGSQKTRQHSHNEKTGRYERQRLRTEANKRRNIERNEQIRRTKLANKRAQAAEVE